MRTRTEKVSITSISQKAWQFQVRSIWLESQAMLLKSRAPLTFYSSITCPGYRVQGREDNSTPRVSPAAAEHVAPGGLRVGPSGTNTRKQKSYHMVKQSVLNA